MGACSSKPRVLEDAPQPAGVIDAVEAADCSHAVLEKEENFQDTFDRIPEDHMQVPTKKGAEAVEEDVPLVDENHVVEVLKATPAAAYVPTESEDVNKVQQFDGVKNSNQEETAAAIDHDDDAHDDTDEPKTVDPVEAAEDSVMPESKGKPNIPETPEENVQEVSAPPFEPKCELSPEAASQEEGSGAPAAAELAGSEGKAAGVSESAVHPQSGNPFQTFMSNVTKGWGWK